MTSWVILRTASRSTLRLAKALSDQQITAWAPSRVKDGRMPKRRARVVLREPILPSFVFADAGEARRLASIEVFPGSLPAFSLFRIDGRVPAVADAELDGLRRREARDALLVKRRIRRPWQAGQHVRISEGPAEGMEGTVEAVQGNYAVVAFGGRLRLKIASFLLVGDELSDAQLLAA